MGVGNPGRLFHVREQKSVSRARMLFVVNQQIAFRDAVSELHDFQFEPIQANSLVAVLAEDERLAVFELNHVFAARLFFRDRFPRAVVEDVAVLQNLDVSRAFVRRGFLQCVFQDAVWKTSTERATNVASAPMAREIGLNGRSVVPKGVDLVFLPISEVGEYWPLVRP